ncbi:MAG TPA: hypothetical protein VGF55_20305 [Gemmataceae bacterium]
MPVPDRLKPVALLATLALLGPAGCAGSNLARVTGQVVANGVPVQLDQGESVQIDFATADQAYPPLALGVFAKKDGTFVADMNDGTGAGLRPGKYKVRLNGESTSVKAKVNPKLFKEAVVIDTAVGAPVRLTIDLAAGTITQ